MTGPQDVVFFTWQVTNAKAAAVIGAIRPFLIAKQIQADLALACHAMNQTHRGRRVPPTTKAEIAEKRQLSAACSALNHGKDIDLSWFKPVKLGRWIPQPYYFDAEAVREESSPNSHGSPNINAGSKQAALGQQRGGNLGQWPPKRQSKKPDGWDTGPGAHGTIHREGREAGELAEIQYGRNLRNVWHIATHPYPDAHFATFPPALVEPCIKAGCPEGGMVLDLFGGSGTVGLVADRLGQDAILIELNPEYADMARVRITEDAPLFAEVG